MDWQNCCMQHKQRKHQRKGVEMAKLKPQFVWLTFLAFLLFSQNCVPGKKVDFPKPRLIVIVVVDQMREDYLDRFEPLFVGGLKRLLDQGVRFRQAYHQHAHTETGPGHAVISTGCYPSHNGIVANTWFDVSHRQNLYCVEDSTVIALTDDETRGRSPRLLVRTTIGDWLKARNPESKVFSVDMKDRTAVLMGGQHPDGAFWYHKNTGTITSSTYYMDSLPEWVNEFNNQKLLDRYFRTGWQRLLPEGEYTASREDNFPHEKDGKRTTFPHLFKQKSAQPNKRFYRDIYSTPFGDEFVLKFARRIAEVNQLGLDDSPDLLMVGCAAADAVGHEFGPYSQEVEDYYLRLDRYLDSLFSYLDENVGTANYKIVLTSDHGALPLPEELQRRGIDAGRINRQLFENALNQAMERAVSAWALPAKEIIISSANGLYLNRELLKSSGVELDRFLAAVKAEIKKIPGVEAVYTYPELQKNQNTENDPYFELYVNNYYPQRSGDVEIRIKKNYLVSKRDVGTTHGSPYDYDRHVPLIFAGFDRSGVAITDTVQTADIAATIADLLDISPDKKIDGRSLLPYLIQE